MQQLLQLTEKAVRNNKAIKKPAKPDPHTNAEQQDGISHSLPRVTTIKPLGNTDRRMTSNITKDTQLVPRVSPTAVTRVEKPPKVAQDDLPLKN